MPTTVRVRQTTTTTTTASVILINTGYLKTKFGLLKLLIFILLLIAFILLLLQGDVRSGYSLFSVEMGFLLIVFAHLYAVGLMLFAALLSLGTASFLPKTSFDFFFHFFAFLLLLIFGLWIVISDQHAYRKKAFIAGILGIASAILHLIHGILSYRSCVTN